MYHQNGLDPTSHGVPAQCAALLWQNIVEEAERSLKGQGDAVTLRFGHDTALYRLLTLLGITTLPDGTPWTALDELVPMVRQPADAFLPQRRRRCSCAVLSE